MLLFCRRLILRTLREFSTSEANISGTALTHMYSALPRLSDESGSMKFTLLDEGKLNKSKLSRKDGELTARCYIHYTLLYSAVFIVDSGSEVFVWIGNAASRAEKLNAMSYAHVSVLQLAMT